MSPSSAVYDRDYKRRAYLTLGVQEYWVADPMQRTIEVSRSLDEAPRVGGRVFRYDVPGTTHCVPIEVPRVFRAVRGLMRM
ncbi:MAG TPA: Uma2 family endonuclease [Gemmatimonadaceae bacterium]|nr:Uma2 family endonuclease [Gemmatimonadaceae bacterium]